MNDRGAASSSRTIDRVAPWLLPLVLWFIGCSFYFGDIGRFSDDYSLSLRTLEDSAYHFPANPWTRWPYFWRPLHLLFISFNATVFHESPWALHLISAACHALAAFSLYRFLRAVHLDRPAAAAGGVLLLTFPFAYEVPLWPATVSTSIALALTLAILTRLARAASSPTPPRLFRLCAALFVVGFCVPCFFEQPAVLLAVAPIAFVLGAGRDAGRSLAHTLRERWKPMLLATASLGAACVLYVALLMGTAPPHARGSASRFPTADELPHRIEKIATMTRDALIGERAHDQLLGSLGYAVEPLRSPVGAVLGVLALAAAVVWCRWAVRDELRRGTGVSPVLAPRLPLLVLVAACWFVVSFTPLATVTRGAVESRLLYVPAAGLCVAAAAVVEFFWRRTRRPRRRNTAIRVVLAAALAAATLTGSVSLLGFQRLMRTRSLQDARVLRQLQQRVPEPPPGTVFVPVRHEQPGAYTDSPRFNWSVDAALSQPWSAWAWLARGYQRSDLSATFLYRRLKPPFIPSSASPNGIVYRSTLPGDAFDHATPGATRLTWDRVVPFSVDRRGKVELHRRLTLHRPDGSTVDVVCPLVPEEGASDEPFVFRLR